VNLKSFFNTLFQWAAALDFPNVLSFRFYFFLSFFFIVRCSCMFHVYVNTPFALFNNILIIYI